MPIDVFFRGGFRRDNIKGAPRTVEWDGTNENDICDWINQSVTEWPPSAGVEGWVQWTVSVADGIATFSGWRGHPFDPNSVMSIQVPESGWVSEWVFPEGPASVKSAGMWKTTDQYGRPDDVAKVFAPGTVLPWA